MSSHPRVFVWCLVLALTQASCMERHLAKKNSNPVIPKVPNKPAAASKADSKLDQGLLALALLAARRWSEAAVLLERVGMVKVTPS